MILRKGAPHMSYDNKPKVPSRHILLIVQLISFSITLLPIQKFLPFSIIAYFIAVFSSPPLLLSYYCFLSSRTKNWSWECLPFIAETVFSVLYVGSMIYGIRFEVNSALFSRLLSAYLVLAFLCTLGYLMYYIEKLQLSIQSK